MRKVTEQDLRHPNFQKGTPDDYEFREDGAIVRKDRWEQGICNIVAFLGLERRVDEPGKAYTEWEVKDVVEGVKQQAAENERLREQLNVLLDKFEDISAKMSSVDKPKSFCHACNICPVGDSELEGRTCRVAVEEYLAEFTG